MTPLKIVCTLVLVLGFFSVLSLAVLWRGQVTTQRRLDRCIQKTALELKKVQNRIESTNHRILIERKAIMAALVVAPETVLSLQIALRAEAALQDAQLRIWNLTQAQWISRRGCDGRSDYFFPLPSLAWIRDPPDAIGENELKWRDSGEKKLSIRLWKPPRHSSALVEKSKKWSARYVQF